MKKKNLSVKKKIHNFYSKKLNDPRIIKIYLNFKKKLTNHITNSFCVAVSGGVDSMALSFLAKCYSCLLYTSPSPRDATLSRMPSSA